MSSIWLLESSFFSFMTLFALPYKLAENFNPLELLKDYTAVFVEKDLPKAKPLQTKAANPKATMTAKENLSKDESFGRIIQKDGSVLVFYKNNQGKIRGEKQ